MHNLDFGADVERFVGHVGAGTPLLPPDLDPPAALEGAKEPTPKTMSWIQMSPPSAATSVAASAASAIGPRKKSPGVKISPTARATATIAQMSQAGMS